ncbi:AzlC family ABC transporter permease, partial [Parafannyhessea umbonata]
MRREVLSAAWPVMVSYVAVGLPCGVLAAKAGMGPLQNFVLALTFLSGGGQFMMSNLWLAGVPLGSIVASVAAVSTRFALYSASLAPYLERFGRRSALAISCCYTE